MHIYNDKWVLTSLRIFYKNSSTLLNCVSINELCSAIDSTVATVHCSWKLHFKALHWNIKIWQDATWEIHYMKQTENMKT